MPRSSLPGGSYWEAHIQKFISRSSYPEVHAENLLSYQCLLTGASNENAGTEPIVIKNKLSIVHFPVQVCVRSREQFLGTILREGFREWFRNRFPHCERKVSF